MKLKQLHEMVMRAGAPFPSYTNEQIQQATEFLRDAVEVTKLEGGAFSLVVKNDIYAIKKNEEVLGWIELKKVSMFNKPFNLVKVLYVRPEFRKKNVTLIFIHALRETLDAPIMVDGAVFEDGEKLIDAIHKRKMYDVYVIDKQTGNKETYSPKSINFDNKKSFLVIENEQDGLFICGLPGHPEVKTYFSRFEDLHDVEI